MLSYETLDAIADSYNPLLGIISLLLIPTALWAKRWRLAGTRFLSIVVGLVVAYGLMFTDNKLRIWPKFGLDYSTHTAVAVFLVVYLVINARRLTALWVGSLFAYFALMVYQRYHSVADIVTTSVVVIVPMVAGMWYLRPRAN